MLALDPRHVAANVIDRVPIETAWVLETADARRTTSSLLAIEHPKIAGGLTLHAFAPDLLPTSAAASRVHVILARCKVRVRVTLVDDFGNPRLAFGDRVVVQMHALDRPLELMRAYQKSAPSADGPWYAFNIDFDHRPATYVVTALVNDEPIGDGAATFEAVSETVGTLSPAISTLGGAPGSPARARSGSASAAAASVRRWTSRHSVESEGDEDGDGDPELLAWEVDSAAVSAAYCWIVDDARLALHWSLTVRDVGAFAATFPTTAVFSYSGGMASGGASGDPPRVPVVRVGHVSSDRVQLFWNSTRAPPLVGQLVRERLHGGAQPAGVGVFAPAGVQSGDGDEFDFHAYCLESMQVFEETVQPLVVHGSAKETAAKVYHRAAVRQVGKSRWRVVYFGDGDQCLVTGLQPATTYAVRLQACTSRAVSPWGRSVRCKTNGFVDGARADAPPVLESEMRSEAALARGGAGDGPAVPPLLRMPSVQTIRRSSGVKCRAFEDAADFLDTLRLDAGFFDRAHDRCFCAQCHEGQPTTLIRGLDDWPYVVPTGWYRFGLQVNETFAKHHRVFDNWCVAYHGTTRRAIESVLAHQQLLMANDTLLDGTRLPIREGHADEQFFIFTSPSVRYASLAIYASPVEFRPGLFAQVVFQVRQRPGSFEVQGETVLAAADRDMVRLDDKFLNSELEWKTTRRSTILPYGLLVRVLTREQVQAMGLHR